MLVDYWLLIFALILLWLPRQWLRSGGAVIPSPRLRRRAAKDHDPNDLSLRWREEFFKFRNWVDLGRGAVGAWAIMNACLETEPGAPKSDGVVLLIVQAIILVIAVFIQTARRERRETTLVAPVFFVMGLSLGLIGGTPALFAIIMVWTLNRVLPNVGVFLCVFAVLQVCFGLALGASMAATAIAGGLSGLPVLLSAATRRTLERIGRQSSSGR